MVVYSHEEFMKMIEEKNNPKEKSKKIKTKKGKKKDGR